MTAPAPPAMSAARVAYEAVAAWPDKDRWNADGTITLPGDVFMHFLVCRNFVEAALRSAAPSGVVVPRPVYIKDNSEECQLTLCYGDVEKFVDAKRALWPPQKDPAP